MPFLNLLIMDGDIRVKPMTLAGAVISVGRRGRMYLRGLKEEEWAKLSKKEFIKKFFSGWNYTHQSCFKSNHQAQCKTNARRSAGDMTLILRSCYPKTTLLEVRDILKELVKEGFLNSYICSTVRRRVFWYMGSGGMEASAGRRDEFGWKWDEDIKNNNI